MEHELFFFSLLLSFFLLSLLVIFIFLHYILVGVRDCDYYLSFFKGR